MKGILIMLYPEDTYGPDIIGLLQRLEKYVRAKDDAAIELLESIKARVIQWEHNQRFNAPLDARSKNTILPNNLPAGVHIGDPDRSLIDQPTRRIRTTVTSRDWHETAVNKLNSHLSSQEE
jgi:hypothetical protein